MKFIGFCMSCKDDDMAEKIFYNRIKAVLAEQNVSSKELAEFLDKSQTTVSRWCTNDVQPPIETLYQIARYLKVDIRELLTATK